MQNVTKKLIVPSMEDRILVLRIDNLPDNLMPPDFFIELEERYQRMVSPDVDAVIFTGTGRVFSKGADLARLKASQHQPDEKALVFANGLVDAISHLNKPLIAAINGTCLGGGLELALACHLRLSVEKARLGLPETSAGLIPGLGGLQRLIRIAGEAKALEMVMMGDIMSAESALELNLINRILPREDFLQKVLFFTRTLLSTSKDAIAAILEIAAGLRAQADTAQALDTVRLFTKLVQNKMG